MALQIARITRLLTTSTLSLLGGKQACTPLPLQRQPCVLNIPVFLVFISEHKGLLPSTLLLNDTLVCLLCLVPRVLSRKTTLWARPPGDRTRRDIQIVLVIAQHSSDVTSNGGTFT